MRKAHQPGVVNDDSSAIRRLDERTDDEHRKLALESVDALVLIVKTHGGTCDFVNSQWFDHTGQSDETLFETPFGWTEAIHPEDRDRIVLFTRTAVETNVDARDAYRVYCEQAKSYRWFELRVVPICPRTGLGTLAFNDIHETRRVKRELSDLESKMRRGEKMQSLGQLAGGVAHDFNNLLTIIVACADEALEQTEVAAHREPLHEIRLAVKRATSLTRDLLGYSRQEEHQRRVMPLDAVVDEAERMLVRIVGEDVDLRVDRGGKEVGSVRIDPAQWTSVVMNLAVNARHAMPRGGILSIHTSSRVITEVDARAEASAIAAGVEPRLPRGLPAGRYAVLEIRDTGVGFGPDVARKIFEPFFTTKSAGKGTGLGLAVVKSIVDESEGFIGVKSEVGRGTTFQIYLPVAVVLTEPPFSSAAPPKAIALGDRVAETDANTETVLLVEDDPAVRRAAMRSLEARGFVLLVANDAEEALAILDDKAGAVDLVITDVVLPKMNGKRLVDEINGRYPKIRALFTSGYANEDVLRYGLMTSADGVSFLPKPYTPRRLVRKMREVLDRP